MEVAICMAGCVVIFRIMVMDVYYLSLYYLGIGRVEGRRWNLAAWIYPTDIRFVRSTASKQHGTKQNNET